MRSFFFLKKEFQCCVFCFRFLSVVFFAFFVFVVPLIFSTTFQFVIAAVCCTMTRSLFPPTDTEGPHSV